MLFLLELNCCLLDDCYVIIYNKVINKKDFIVVKNDGFDFVV